jgi:hypothetical protein
MMVMIYRGGLPLLSDGMDAMKRIDDDQRYDEHRELSIDKIAEQVA